MQGAECLAFGLFQFVFESRNSKICNLNGSVRKKHDILRFNVAVNNPTLMCVLERISYLP